MNTKSEAIKANESAIGINNIVSVGLNKNVPITTTLPTNKAAIPVFELNNSVTSPNKLVKKVLPLKSARLKIALKIIELREQVPVAHNCPVVMKSKSIKINSVM